MPNSQIHHYVSFLFFFVCLFFVLVSSGPYPWHMVVPRLGVELELQLPAYSIATPDRSRVCDLHHSSRQCWILKPPSEASDQTHVLMDTCWVHLPLSRNRNSCIVIFLVSFSLHVTSSWSPPFSFYFSSSSSSFFFGLAPVMWKFPGQELNLCQSSDLNCCSDNTRSLTLCTTELLFLLTIKKTSEHILLDMWTYSLVTCIFIPGSDHF